MRDRIKVIFSSSKFRFPMKRWQWALLIFELVLFAVILILPQVELPEFTFRGGTAPIAAKARLSLARVQSASAIQLPMLIPRRILEALETRLVLPPARLETRLSLMCILIC
jgi:ABC-type sulfate transport system permease subunit